MVIPLGGVIHNKLAHLHWQGLAHWQGPAYWKGPALWQGPAHWQGPAKVRNGSCKKSSFHSGRAIKTLLSPPPPPP